MACAASTRVHFVGIGGSGMGGIAEVLLNLGYAVQGSDLKANGVTRHLAKLGARVLIGHEATNMEGADAVVVSTAINRDNPEVAAALAARVPVVPRARDAGRADALPLRHRGGRHAWQDHHHQPRGRACSPRAARIRPS